VNLASRLESLSKKLDTDLVVSGEALAACTREHDLKRIDEIHVKGRARGVVIFGG
jgi:class 3 adenylate cyclase